MRYRLLRWLLRAGLGVLLAGILTVRGRSRVPRSGPLLVCTNHISTLDPALVPAYVGFSLPRRAPVDLVFGTPFTVVARRDDGTRVEYREASDAIMLSVAELLPAELRGDFADLDSWRRRVGDLRRWEAGPVSVAPRS